MKTDTIGLKIDENERKMVNTLRKKHYINVPAFLRDSIKNLYNKLENKT